MNATPRLPASLQWPGRPPLHLDTGLAGHVVVVVTWRVGCALCREALADIARAVAPFAGEAVAVVALHVPVESGERDLARVQREVAALPFASAIDAEQAWLRQQGTRALPHVALLDAEGRQVFAGAGVPFRRRLRDAIEALLQQARDDGRAATWPWLPMRPARLPFSPTALAAVGDEIWLASAGHRRVYALDASGRVLRTFGSGKAGQADGSAAQAEFVQPAALLPLGEHVLVADAGAHTLRAIECGSGDVATWSGTGQRGSDRQGGGYARDQALCGPRALCRHDGGVVVAMGLGRQLWQFDPATRAAVAWCGSGEPARRDGDEPAFLEPCALAADDMTLFVADVGAVRALDLAHGRLSTPWSSLQRPSALCRHADELWVADRWQATVARLDVGAAAPRPWLGPEHGLVEPVALARVGGQLWIADAGVDALWVGDPDDPSPRLQRVAVLADAPATAVDDRTHAWCGTPLRLRADADVPLRVPVAELAGEGGLCEVDVRDEGFPLLACPRNVTVPAHGGCAEVLLPIGTGGEGGLRIRVRCGARTRQFLVAVAANLTGDLAATLSVDG